MSDDHLVRGNGTPLQRVLWWHGQFRRRFEPLHVTPLQAGVLLFLRGHEESTLKEAATALCVRSATLTQVVKDLARKKWVTKDYAVKDRRFLCLRLSQRGKRLVERITDQVQDMKIDSL